MQEILDLRLHRIRALLRTHLADLPVLARRGNRLAPFPLAVRQRLLDIHVLAGLHGPDRRQAVPVVAGRDNYRVNTLVVQQFAQVRIPFGLGVRFAGPRHQLLVRITKRGEVDAFDRLELALQLS